MFSKSRNPPKSARERPACEVAWALLEIARIARLFALRGACLCAHHPRKIMWNGNTMCYRDTKQKPSFQSFRQNLRQHDMGCQLFGISREMLAILLDRWTSSDVATFLIDAVDEAIEDATAEHLGSVAGYEPLAHAVGRRISVQIPADHEMAVNQMPRSASNAPSSRRFFTWVRNLAASAPSMMR